ncbi:MAG: MAPEG family protein [Candidatus Azotimanducaceae bacterium]|tara:strand:+ start:120 stop:551 length:432 start_codon:yes stop_codon:yes gene_type:complete
MEDYPFSMLITALLLIGNWWLASRVSYARGKFARENNSEGFDHSAQIYMQTDFMHIFRNHANFHEHLMVFLPVFWLSAICYSDLLAAFFGSLFLFGRAMYAKNYPTSHRAGFLISLFSFFILLIGVAVKAIYIITDKYLSIGI